MAFSFLSPNFFNVQARDSLPTPPTTPVIPCNPLPGPAVLETSAFTSYSSHNVNNTHSSSCPRVSPPVSALSMDTPARYVPKAFVYNTPINRPTFGAILDSGYKSLSSRTSHYHSPLTPATPLPNKSTPCETYLQLYNSGDLAARGVGNCWEIQCIICDKWVRTSVPTRRSLSIPNHFSNLESHCTSTNCMARPARASTAPPVLSPRKSASSSAIPPGAVEDDDDDEHFDFQCVFCKYSSTSLLTCDQIRQILLSSAGCSLLSSARVPIHCPFSDGHRTDVPRQQTRLARRRRPIHGDVPLPQNRDTIRFSLVQCRNTRPWHKNHRVFQGVYRGGASRRLLFALRENSGRSPEAR